MAVAAVLPLLSDLGHTASAAAFYSVFTQVPHGWDTSLKRNKMILNLTDTTNTINACLFLTDNPLSFINDSTVEYLFMLNTCSTWGHLCRRRSLQETLLAVCPLLPVDSHSFLQDEKWVAAIKCLTKHIHDITVNRSIYR